MQADGKFKEAENVSLYRLDLSLVLTLFKLFVGFLTKNTLFLAEAACPTLGFLNEYKVFLDFSVTSKCLKKEKEKSNFILTR